MPGVDRVPLPVETSRQCSYTVLFLWGLTYHIGKTSERNVQVRGSGFDAKNGGACKTGVNLK